MVNRIKIANLFIVLCFCYFNFSGCESKGIVKPPADNQNKIKEYKDVVVKADNPYPTETGLILKKGDLYTIIVTGKVNTNPSQNPDRWQGPQRRLGMFVDDEYWGVAPANKTLESHHSGELKIFVHDAAFDFQKGRARDLFHYDNNIGSFNVTIIIYEETNWDIIVDILQQLEESNPGNEAVKSAFAQADSLRQKYEAEKETP